MTLMADPAILPQALNLSGQHRSAEVLINLGALAHNIHWIQRRVGPRCMVMAVVKADGYGHGTKEIASAALAAGACALGVATSDEALALRETQGFEATPILVMAPTLPSEAEPLQRAGVGVAVGSNLVLQTHLNVARRLGVPARLHVQLDTGIGRDGFRFSDFSWLDLLSSAPECLEAMFTHFAVADGLSPEDFEFTELQFSRFIDGAQRVREAGHEPILHAANSGAILRHHGMECHFVRPGMMLYGVDPSGHRLPEDPLQPVLTLRSRLAAIREMEAGDTISYARTFTVPSHRRIGIVPLGYGDGFPVAFSNKGHVLLHGRPAPIRGRVCMDQFMIDLSDHPAAVLGDEVVIYGEQNGASIRLEDCLLYTSDAADE